MARRKHKKSSCPNPINGFIDLCAGVTMAVIARNKLKKDIEKGEGEESLIAGSVVLGHRALRGDPVGLGGMLGLRAALTETEKASLPEHYDYHCQIPVSDTSGLLGTPNVKSKYVWRKYCSITNGIDPQNYESADDFYDAVSNSYNTRENESSQDTHCKTPKNTDKSSTSKKHVWRKYCSDGSQYEINPEDFDCADDFEEAVAKAKAQRS